MYRQFDSPAGRRFLTLIREGGGLKPSARAVGVNKETGYRWLRDEYFRLRGEGLSHAAAQAGLGFFSDRAGGGTNGSWKVGTGATTSRWSRQLRTPSGLPISAERVWKLRPWPQG